MSAVYNEDCLEGMKKLPDNSVDSVITDPPYGLQFMGKKWDYQIPEVAIWREVLRVLKPGGHLLCACGTRTQHRMVVNIEDAGFEIRDVISWIYGSGFPKSLDINKAIDKEFGVHFESVPAKGVGFMNAEGKGGYNVTKNQLIRKGNTSYQAIKHQGWGTALKPAQELWTLARKPLSEKTIAKNVLKHGTGGINIDGSRINLNGEKAPTGSAKRIYASNEYPEDKTYGENTETSPLGRFPANIIFDEFAAAELDKQTGVLTSGTGKVTRRTDNNVFASGNETEFETYGDSGGASRFFYCAKASRSERNKGLEDLEAKPLLWSSGTQNPGSFQSEGTNRTSQNNHPTVKPLKLMQYLVKLITPAQGTCLDPFAGSGTTLIACINLGFGYIAYEREKPYFDIINKRIESALEDML